MSKNETTNVDHRKNGINIEVCLSILEEEKGLNPYSKARATIREYLKANGDIVIPLEKTNTRKPKLPNEYKVKGKTVRKGTDDLAEQIKEEEETR